jgi:hypothetical protein
MANGAMFAIGLSRGFVGVDFLLLISFYWVGKTLLKLILENQAQNPDKYNVLCVIKVTI